MEYKVKRGAYYSDEIKTFQTPSLIQYPKVITWIYSSKLYEIVPKLEFTKINDLTIFNSSVRDYMNSAYLFDDKILILYHPDIKFNNCHSHPYNLVLYNLKKEVVKVIENPMLKKVEEQKAIDKTNEKPPTLWQKIWGIKPPKKHYFVYPMSRLFEITEIKGKKYIPVSLDINPEDCYIYYLDLETFEFHPKYYDYRHDPELAPYVHEEYGREE